MMMLPEASAPPAVGVKVNVAATPVLAATRSAVAMATVTAVTAPPIAPDATDVEAVVSALVCTLTLPPAVAAPKVKPESVTVTAVLAASVVPEVVMTMEVAPGAAMGPREAPPDTAPLGVAVVAKKLAG